MRYEAGIVMGINKNKATLMTKQGEFVEVKLNEKGVQIGQEFNGQISKDIPFYKYSFIAASILFMLFIGGGAYAYYTPVSDITVSINPQIKLQSNRWNKIIKASPLNLDGEKILKNINIKNKDLEVGLNLVVDEARNEKFINEDYIKNGKTIEVTVESKNGLKVDLSKFKSNIENSNLKVKIKNSEEKNQNEDATNSSKEKNNIDIIENGNKIDKDDIKKTDTNSSNNASQNTNVQDKMDKKNNEGAKKDGVNIQQNQKLNEIKEDNKSKNENGIKKEEKKDNIEEKNNNGNNNSKIKEENSKQSKETKHS